MSGNYIHCNLQVTYRCNFRCEICDFWKPEYQRLEELSLEDVRTVADKLLGAGDVHRLARRRGAAHPGRSGQGHRHPGRGPLPHPDHERLVRRRGPLQGPLPLGPAGDHRLGRLRVGRQARRHARPARGLRPGGQGPRAPEEEPAVRLNRVHMITVLMDDNLDEIEDLIRIAQDLKVTYLVTLYSFNRGKKAERLPKKDVSDFLVDLKKKHPDFVSLSGYVKRFDEAIAKGGIGNCLAGKRYLNIDNRGQRGPLHRDDGRAGRQHPPRGDAHPARPAVPAERGDALRPVLDELPGFRRVDVPGQPPQEHPGILQHGQAPLA